MSNLKTAVDLIADGSWEDNYTAFRFAGSKIWWESAISAKRSDKVIVSRVVNRRGKSFIFGLRFISQYVLAKRKIAEFRSRNPNEKL